jgi:alpha-ketoglutaric semialdehyde dehydrogenase
MADPAIVRSVNPAHPDDVVGEWKTVAVDALDGIVDRAWEAQRAWARVPPPARAEVVAACGQVLAARKGELARLVTREVGKIPTEAGGDVQEAIDMAAFVAGLGRMPSGEVVPSELPDKMAYTTRQPVGVAAVIAPWNFPVAIPSWKVFPALLAGTAVVLKPSELAPGCAEAFADALAEAGVPDGLLQVVPGYGELGQALCTHPGVRAVAFTGSVPTGRRVAMACAEHGPKLVALELGGKNAMVVLADADLELVLDGVLFGAFGTAGQRCTSTSRLVVHRSVAGELVDRLCERVAGLTVGDPGGEGTDVGPVIDQRAVDRIDGMVRAARDEGATVVSGGWPVHPAGCEGGTFYAPTVLTGVVPEHRIAREEVFGPVLSVLDVADADEAVAVVNGVDVGLSAAVYTRDVTQALRMVDRIDTGIVYVNAPTIGAEISLPFGGTKHTGNGFRDAGRRGLEQFSELKSVYVDYSGRLQRAQIDNRPPAGDRSEPSTDAPGGATR